MWTSDICWSVASERQIIRATHSNAKGRLGNIDMYFNFIYFEIPTIGTYRVTRKKVGKSKLL